MRLAALLLLPLTLAAQQNPTPEAAPWWHLTSDLSSDGMQGRDTGSAGYERAARYVAAHLKQAGLQPAGERGTFFQRVPMQQVDLDPVLSRVEVVGPNASVTPLALLQQVTLSPDPHLPPALEGSVVFVGYGNPGPAVDLHGKVALYFNGSPKTLSAADRDSLTAARAHLRATALAVVSIDNPNAIEPFHWPAAYARTVTLTDPAANQQAPAAPALRLSTDAASALFAGLPKDTSFGPLLDAARLGGPLPTVALPTRLRLRLAVHTRLISSPNILATLPGSDATLAPEFVALSAHLDGYGFGVPIEGDALYNGALDDAAYVATLLELAGHLAHAPAAQRPRRSLLFCIFTGEEKGLLGSAYFTHHPTMPIRQIVSDLNLDQLRPIFPLRVLTMEGLTDSTLGDLARTVATRNHIELRPDREPERNLFRRADNYNFVRAGIPVASFIFGYDPGSAEERTYRDWYAHRYHKPQDDLTTPIDWQAAVAFNRFFRDFALTIANTPARPQWSPASPNAPHP